MPCTVVLKVWSRILEVSKALSLSSWSQIYFCNTKMSFAIFTLLTFALKVQKQWWRKLLVSHQNSGHWYQTASFTIIHSSKRKKNQIHLRISTMQKKSINFTKSQPMNMSFLLLPVIKYKIYIGTSSIY